MSTPFCTLHLAMHNVTEANVTLYRQFAVVAGSPGTCMRPLGAVSGPLGSFTSGCTTSGSSQPAYHQLYLRAELYIMFSPASTAMATHSSPKQLCYEPPSSRLWQPPLPWPVIHAMAQLILTWLTFGSPSTHPTPVLVVRAQDGLTLGRYLGS
jgi:hypothetical protein